MSALSWMMYLQPVNKDRLSKERRSWNMSRIRGKDTTPEKTVRSVLHRMGYRFRLHVRVPVAAVYDRRGDAHRAPLQSGRAKLPLRPELAAQQRRPTRSVSVDIVLPKYKTAIFVHGCFWHRHKGCKNCTTPTNRREWWLAKLNGNAARDKRHQAALRKLGWRVVVIWECEAETNRLLRQLSRLHAKPLPEQK